MGLGVRQTALVLAPSGRRRIWASARSRCAKLDRKQVVLSLNNLCGSGSFFELWIAETCIPARAGRGLSVQPIPSMAFFQVDFVGCRRRMADGDVGASTEDQRRAQRVPFVDRAVLQIGSTETPSKFVNFSKRRGAALLRHHGGCRPGAKFNCRSRVSGWSFGATRLSDIETRKA